MCVYKQSENLIVERLCHIVAITGFEDYRVIFQDYSVCCSFACGHCQIGCLVK